MNNRTSKFVSYLFPTLENMVWMAAFFVVLIAGRLMMNVDGDLALHLSMGRYILNHAEIPLYDVFSHTLAGQPTAQHKWLSQVIFAFIERIFGLEGVVLLCALVIASTFWLVYKRNRNQGKFITTGFLVSFFVMITSIVHWLTRPHIFTFLLLVIWMIVLHYLRNVKPQRWWLLPTLMLLWVNLHGGFIAGFVTWLIFGFGIGWDIILGSKADNKKLPSKFWCNYLLGGVTAFGASLLNPSGFGLWKMLFTHLGSRYLADFTKEFRSPNFHIFIFWPFLIYIVLLLILLGMCEKKVRSESLFNAAAWLSMALYSARNIPLFAIVSAPLLVQGLDGLFVMAASRFAVMKSLMHVDIRIQKFDMQHKGYVWPILYILIVVVGLSWGFRFDIHRQGYDFDSEVFPVDAVDWLQENPQEGKMFNEFVWGGYLQYRLWPEKRVFIDSNSDFYGEAFVRQYEQVISLQEGWEGVLAEYDVSWAILPLDMQVASAIQRDLGWEVIYQDETAVIMRRE